MFFKAHNSSTTVINLEKVAYFEIKHTEDSELSLVVANFSPKEATAIYGGSPDECKVFLTEIENKLRESNQFFIVD